MPLPTSHASLQHPTVKTSVLLAKKPGSRRSAATSNGARAIDAGPGFTIGRVTRRCSTRSMRRSSSRTGATTRPAGDDSRPSAIRVRRSGRVRPNRSDNRSMSGARQETHRRNQRSSSYPGRRLLRGGQNRRFSVKRTACPAEAVRGNLSFTNFGRASNGTKSRSRFITASKLRSRPNRFCDGGVQTAPIRRFPVPRARGSTVLDLKSESRPR
jgi:hypothetical protein